MLVLHSSTAGFSRMTDDPLKPGFHLYSRLQDIEAGKGGVSAPRIAEFISLTPPGL